MALAGVSTFATHRCFEASPVVAANFLKLQYSVLHCFRMLQEQSRQVPGHQGGGGRDGEAESSALMHTVHVCFRRIHATLSCSVTLSGYFLKPFPEFTRMVFALSAPLACYWHHGLTTPTLD